MTFELTIFSHFSFLFCFVQLWVGVVIHSQPFFIAGVDDPEHAETSAFGAMFMFLFTFAASIAGIWYDTKKKSEQPAEGTPYELSKENFPQYGALS